MPEGTEDDLLFPITTLVASSFYDVSSNGFLYGIFQTPFFRDQPNLNERCAKIEFLRINKESYNSYIMGSSRANTIPDVVEKYLPGLKFYTTGPI